MIFVKVGEWNLSNNNDGAKVIKVKKIHAHPQYGVNTDIDMDFSILELKEDLEFSESVRPACLPQSDITYAGVDGKSIRFGDWTCQMIGVSFQLWYPDGELCHQEEALRTNCKRSPSKSPKTPIVATTLKTRSQQT